MGDQINYPELGGTGGKKNFYKDGETYVHPSGAVYKYVDGGWRLVSKPPESEEDKTKDSGPTSEG